LLAEELSVSKEGLCSMGLVGYVHFLFCFPTQCFAYIVTYVVMFVQFCIDVSAVQLPGYVFLLLPQTIWVNIVEVC